MNSQTKVAAVLKKTFLFQNVSPTEFSSISAVLSDCTFLDYTPGSVVQSAKDPVSGIAILVNGKAEILSSLSEDAVPLRLLAPGAIFGAATLYAADPHYSTVIRATEASEVLLIPDKTVKLLLRQYPDVAENYIRFLSERICFLNRKLSAFTAGSVEAKLGAYLSGLPVKPDGVLLLPGSLSEMAKTLGMGRASLYRSLKKLESDGIIRHSGKTIQLLNADALIPPFR